MYGLGTGPAFRGNRTQKITGTSVYSPARRTTEKGGDVAYCRDSRAALNERGVAAPRGGRWYPTSAARLLRRLGGLTAAGLNAGDKPPKPPAEPPAEQIIRIPRDKIRPPEQGPPKPERSPEIRIPPERIKTPEERIRIPPGVPPHIAPPPAPEDRAKDSDD